MSRQMQWVRAAQLVCAMVWLVSCSTDESPVASDQAYDAAEELARITASVTHNSCQGSVPEAIIAFLESISLEDCVRNAISIGGDSDTTAAIACSIYAAKTTSEDEELMKSFEYYLPQDLMQIMERFEKQVGKCRF